MFGGETMLKKVTVLLLVLCVTFLLAGCGTKKEYEEEAGVYELVEMSGDLNMSMFKTYTIDLRANGQVYVKTTYNGNSTVYEGDGKFEIKDNKIIIKTSQGSQTVTEEYDYIDGEIIMDNITLQTINFTAKFRRAATE
jgi:hypothetical protein